MFSRVGDHSFQLWFGFIYAGISLGSISGNENFFKYLA